MASFTVNEKAGGITEYSCIIDNVISRIRFEKYILCVKRRHGDIAELILNELLLHGQMAVNQVVDSIIEKLGTQGKYCTAVVNFCSIVGHCHSAWEKLIWLIDPVLCKLKTYSFQYIVVIVGARAPQVEKNFFGVIYRG